MKKEEFYTKIKNKGGQEVKNEKKNLLQTKPEVKSAEILPLSSTEVKKGKNFSIKQGSK